MGLARRFAVVLLPCIAFSQNPSFDAATVKPAPPGSASPIGSSRGGPGSDDPSNVRFENTTLRQVLTIAFAVDGDQVVGPKWIDSRRYDIAATLPSGTTQAQFESMLQRLVEERFQMRWHREKRDLPTWELVVAKGGSKLGKEQASAGDYPLPRQHQTAQKIQGGVAYMAGAAIDMATLVRFLRFPIAVQESAGGTALQNLEFPRVMDGTGISGEFDVRLHYRWGGTPATPDVASSGEPDIFAAIEGQLGLRLQKRRIATDVIVVDDGREDPTEN